MSPRSVSSCEAWVRRTDFGVALILYRRYFDPEYAAESSYTAGLRGLTPTANTNVARSGFAGIFRVES